MVIHDFLSFSEKLTQKKSKYHMLVVVFIYTYFSNAVILWSQNYVKTLNHLIPLEFNYLFNISLCIESIIKVPYCLSIM